MVGGAPLPGGRREPLLGSLRAELRALARGDAAPAAPAAPGGTEPLLVAEELFPSAAFPAELFGPGFRWEGGEGPVLLDLETCGLADDPIFLLGVLRPEEAGLRLLHVLARDPSGEPALLRRAGELLPAEAPWVSFNGRSFDAPRLLRRAAHHGVALRPPSVHQDLLHLVRRRWKGQLPDCRLLTVERRLLGLERRADDVPGREVPERYRDYVRSGDFRWIAPVLEHNRRDLCAMAVLRGRLLREGGI